MEQELNLKSVSGTGGDTLTREAEVRTSYKRALEREREAMLAVVPAGADRTRIARAWDELQALEAKLESFRGQIASVVDARVDELRRRLEIEAEFLTRYAVDYSQLQGDVELVGGEIAYGHWHRVESVFSHLVLAADVGVVDVVWLRKEARSADVDELIDERNKERDILKEDFEQVLKELGQDTEAL